MKYTFDDFMKYATMMRRMGCPNNLMALRHNMVIVGFIPGSPVWVANNDNYPLWS